MSGFDLVPVDGGELIHLPPGETVLGRGPFLGIGDKRVSRLHGLLENLDGQLRLKPTHVNPCFVQSSPTDEPRPLQRNTWHPLHRGDLFSLLPGQFIYKVVAAGGEDITPRNSQMLEEEELPVSSKPDEEPPPPVREDHRETPAAAAAAPSRQQEADSPDRSLNKRDPAHVEQVEAEQSDVRASVRRSRVLPAWMMAAVATPHSSSSSTTVQSAVKKTKGASATSTSTKRAAARQTKTSSPEEVELSEEERPMKRRRKISSAEEEEAAPSKTDVLSGPRTVLLYAESNRPDVSDESDSFTVEEDKEGGGGGDVSIADGNNTKWSNAVSQPEKEDKKLKNGRQMTDRTESNGSNSGSASRPTPSKAQLRVPCPYGKDCYRKNPLHFQECSHPGDSDYEEKEDEEEADRPECPYGTSCYRKNPLHRKEYKHTKKPASTRRTVHNKTPADDEDEDEDFGDDDSFINDDSEDGGNDSDYVPPDSDDSGKEDIKQLQKEAKGFLKRRK